jgi:hypothetical protein
MKTYYFAGGLYYNNYNRTSEGTHFDAVSAGSGHLPYVTLNERGLRLTSHHSSLYRLSNDFTEAFLVDRRNGGNEPSPRKIALPVELQEKIKKAIESEDFYD